MASNQPQVKAEINQIITKLSNREDLTTAEAQYAAKTVFTALTENKPNSLALLFSLFGGLTIKKPSVAELAGMVKAMDATKTFEFQFNSNKPIVTAGGTGGDTFPTINVTTPAVIIAAAAGACAIKSGSKSFSSKTGCIDLAEELGVNVYADPAAVQACVDKIGTAIWASEGIYPWMRPLIDLASEESASAIMPLLYSLRLMIATALNPFSLKRQVRGVSQPFTETIAQVLAKSGYEKALVVLGYGADENTRIDEFSNMGKNVVSEVRSDGSVVTYDFHPTDIGVRLGVARDIMYPGSHAANTHAITNVLCGRDRSARRDLILLNAASILYVANVVRNLRDGYELAGQAVDEGRATEKLRQLVKFSGGKIERLELILNSAIGA